MTNHILQWNNRSVKANFEELTVLINEKKPVAVCLQETFLKDSDKFSVKYHSCGGGDKGSGGVAVIVNECSAPSCEAQLKPSSSCSQHFP